MSTSTATGGSPAPGTGPEVPDRHRAAPDASVRRPWLARHSHGRFALIVLLLTVVVTLAAALWVVPDRQGPRPAEGPGATADVPTGADAMQRRVLAELGIFVDWLEENDVEGYVGEIGIPGDGDPRWLALADRWADVAEQGGLWVDVWSVGEWWGTDYDYSPFVTEPDGGPLAVARAHGRWLAEQAARSRSSWGVNVSGGEFGSAGGTEQVTEFSNRNRGVYGRDYRYEPQETFDYVAAQGLRTVRVPFRWERIQPQLGGPLDRTELGRLGAAVERAAAAGLEVVLDVHNFGAYHLHDGDGGVRQPIGSRAVTRAHFADLWRRLSEAFAGVPGVLAYDLMNEPVDLPAADGLPPAKVWEAASQDAVDAIRSTGDDTLIMVPGYHWSHAGQWTEHHARAWIDDPADNVRYAAHHYWRLDYGRSYDTEVTHAQDIGY